MKCRHLLQPNAASFFDKPTPKAGYQKWLLLILVLLGSGMRVHASHIVGGELYMTHTNGEAYELGLNLYYDEISAADPVLKEDYIRVTIFRKKDNIFMENVDLGLFKNQGLLTYNNPACQNYNLVRNSRLWYYAAVTLSASRYNDAGGYYAVWERCCRNANISNIYTPNESGNVFYLEFPAVTRNNLTFTNSSPEFGQITGDYACVNSPFYFEFGGTDADGDSLVYTLVNPLKGYAVACAGTGPNACRCPDNCSYPANPVRRTQFGTTIDPDPTNHPAPYPTITWAPGYSLEKSTPGPLPLQVGNRTGIVTFTADRLGLYAFAVLCEEYRKGVKIGAVQRDFQIRVVTCPVNNPPTVSIKENRPRQFVSETQTFTVAKTDSLCFEVDLTDKISGTIFTSSNLAANVIAVNFPAALVSLSPTTGVIRNDTDTLRAALCFEKCAAAEINQPLQIKLVVRDDGCGGGLADTLTLNFEFERLIQDPPEIMTNLPGNTASIYVHQTIQFDVIATSTSEEPITIRAAGRGFELATLGMQFEDGKTGTKQVVSPFTWTPDCSVLDLLQNNTFLIDFFTESANCKQKYDTTTVTIVVQDSVSDDSYFQPANVFTPNGDEWNEYFEMSDNADTTLNLPRDNCKERFDRIEVYNRWGRRVFTSHDRHFKWEASHFPTGSYYYMIYYTSRRYKGWVSVLK